MSDKKIIFKQEQEHLGQIYKLLLSQSKNLKVFLAEGYDKFKETMGEMDSDVSLNFDNYADGLDTYASIEMKNREIDQVNLAMRTAENQVDSIERLLESPYFGKIDVDFKDNQPVESFYIGINGFTDEERNPLIFDWRSPIAELFYNNELGASSYEANNQMVDVNIDNRRQLITQKDQLLQYFDSDIAIQDDVLLSALEQDNEGKMQKITSSIQKEQNVIIRDLEHPILLVNGVAGSGKTSTVMQRIAYLLYYHRKSLRSDDVLILSPNQTFIQYVSDVLPSLGEKSPLNLTMRHFAERVLNKRYSIETEEAYFTRIMSDAIDEQTKTIRSQSFIDFIKKTGNELLLKHEPSFRSISQKGKIVISKKMMKRLYDSTPTEETFYNRIQATNHKLLQYWDQRLRKQANDPATLDYIRTLTEEQQFDFFGELIEDDSTASIKRYAKKRLRSRYRKIEHYIRRNLWVDLTKMFEQIYQDYSGQDYIFSENKKLSLDEAVIHLFIYQLFIEKLSVPKLKFLFIDEVQDFTPAQLELLFTVFDKASYTMVGDENQAIFNSFISFDDIAKIFNKTSSESQTERYQLVNSYRSTGSITEVFGQLSTKNQKMEIIPIRPHGDIPTFESFETQEDFVELIEKRLEEIEKLTVLTKTEKETDDLLEVTQHLNDQVEIHSISLAKGLEFENVVIYNASADNFQSERDKRILYTAVSRATQTLMVTYKNEFVSWIQ